MTIEMLKTLSTISFIASALLLLITGALFFILDIPKVYGEISGKTARRAIEAINRQNKSEGTSIRKNKAADKKMTDKITPSGRLVPKTGALEPKAQTEKFATASLNPQPDQKPAAYNQTTVLQGSPAAEMPAGGTTVLPYAAENYPAFGNTTVLQAETAAPSPASYAETTLLKRETASPLLREEKAVTVDVEIGFTGSEEIII